jgi:hypothetical protein
MAGNELSCHDWIVTCPPWPPANFDAGQPQSTTAPYRPTAIPIEWRPFALVTAHRLAEDMILDLPAVLQSYQNRPASRISDTWSIAINSGHRFFSSSNDMSVTMYWSKLFGFIAVLCQELGCRLLQSYGSYHQVAGVRMLWSVGLGDEALVAGEAKTEMALTQHAAEMEGLARDP